MAQVCSPPTLMEVNSTQIAVSTILGYVELMAKPKPSCPANPSPQHTTSLLSKRAQAWPSDRSNDVAVRPLPRPTSTGDHVVEGFTCPIGPAESPQQAITPSLVRPQNVEFEPLTSMNGSFSNVTSVEPLYSLPTHFVVPNMVSIHKFSFELAMLTAYLLSFVETEDNDGEFEHATPSELT